MGYHSAEGPVHDAARRRDAPLFVMRSVSLHWRQVSAANAGARFPSVSAANRRESTFNRGAAAFLFPNKVSPTAIIHKDQSSLFGLVCNTCDSLGFLARRSGVAPFPPFRFAVTMWTIIREA